MVTEFKLPDIGEGLEEGEVVKWLVKEGDLVKADQNIVTMETDKAVADLPAPVGGKMLKINFKEGDTVKVGEVLCVIGGEGEKVTGKKVSVEDKLSKKSVQVGNVSGAVVKKEDEAKDSEEKDVEIEEVPQSEPMKGEAQTQKVLAAPAVRKLARDLKVDLASVKGSGGGGRILKKDIDALSEEKDGSNGVKKSGGVVVPQQTIIKKRKYDQFGYVERIPLKGIRKTIAVNMIKSLEGSAQLTAMDDIDVSSLWIHRNKEKVRYAKDGIKLTFLPFIVKAVVSALKENPILNSSIEGEEIIIKKYFNIGIAVESDVGLMVPVVKIAEKKNVAMIAKEIAQLAEKVRSRKIDVMDMKGSTFTITNYGSVGGTYATPILNKGEAGILGLGRIYDRAVLDDKGKVKNVKILPISLTFDHRILDGAEAARFIESLKMFLEDLDHLFLSVK